MTVDNLYINGSSFASGWGEGYEDTMTVTPLPSWVTYFNDLTSPNKLYLDALVGKGVGTTCRDTIAFCKKYKEKHGSCDDLNVILELTVCRYRHWDPIKSLSGEDIIPVAYIAWQDVNTTSYYFIKREFNDDTLLYTNTIVGEHDLVPEELAIWKKELSDWFFGIDHYLAYLEYGKKEVSRMTRHLDKENIKYAIFWCVGRGPMFTRVMDRGFRKEMKDNKMIPLNIMNGQTLAFNESNDNGYRGHPDSKGHMFLAKFLRDWISENKLFERTHV